jgi:hypothetical protein
MITRELTENLADIIVHQCLEETRPSAIQIPALGSVGCGRQAHVPGRARQTGQTPPRRASRSKDAWRI